jgi:hypothetical protein
LVGSVGADVGTVGVGNRPLVGSVGADVGNVGVGNRPLVGGRRALLEATSVKRMKSEGCVISKEAGTVYRRRERERKRDQASERGEVRREE